MVFFSLISTFAAGNPELVLQKYQGLHQAYEWRIKQERILATPEWNVDSTNIPIAPDKAWQITKDWFLKQGKPRPDFVRIEIRPFVPESENTKLDERLKKKFYYQIQCSPTHYAEGGKFDYMFVFVLMDGTVLEPILIDSLEGDKK